MPKRLIPSLYVLIFSLSLIINVNGQELNAEVQISTPQLTKSDPKIFETLKGTLEEFMRTQKWTDVQYEDHEKIRCSFQMTVREELDNDFFRAEVFILATRPVYGSSYETVLISHMDKDVLFQYKEFQPVEYSEGGYSDNLSAVFSFYAYLILALDYDSFLPNGGDLYFTKAQTVMNNIPPGEASKHGGWSPKDGSRNRYWIIENILSPRVRSYRQAMYDYHINGLDIMESNPDQGKISIQSALVQLDKVNKSYPNSMILQMFSNAKSDEIVEIYKQARSDQKYKVEQIMTKIDPSNVNKYRSIK